MTGERKYFAGTYRRGEPSIRKEGLWRERDGAMEVFSLIDLSWHERRDFQPAMVEVDRETAERFIRQTRGSHDPEEIDADPVGVSFSVYRTFDLADRAGLLVSGRAEIGVITSGMTLYNQAYPEPLLVLGIEFPTPAAVANDLVTLVLDRHGTQNLRPGHILKHAPSHRVP